MSKIDNAILGLSMLGDVIKPILLKENYEGLGEDDVKELQMHLDMAVDGLKKKKPRKVKEIKVPKEWGGLLIRCDVCTTDLIEKYKYCPNCGQRLDWR